MEKQGVPMNQYPIPDPVTGQQPPVYHSDPNHQQYQQTQMYSHPQQEGQSAYGGSPPPQGMYGQPLQQQPMQMSAQNGQYGQGGQPGMPPQQSGGHAYQNVTPLGGLNRSPAPVDCPACGQRALTTTHLETGNTTHAWALIVCCLTCLGCIPYLMSSLKDVQHRCSKCGVLLATWHRSGSANVHIHS
ncbi:hypothetical protein CC78DRAFT_314208 [Lojkania enalia]|uniref:LITAF domain-containing protein n=1 Tax=Lojkania enalia TaxID=147567 RepID=A0A9P4N7Q4_9PLEO|nr:hypothetical protein CC78DRAFT_314208 [Didymosphaeria enalia]